MILDESYENLKSVAIQKYATELQNGSNKIDIVSLRELFASKINSPRMLSQVSDVTSLIRILEKRGALSPVNIEALELIYYVLKLGADDLNEHGNIINNGGGCLFTKIYDSKNEDCMINVGEPNDCLFKNGNHCNSSHSNGTPHMTLIRLPDRVVDTVCRQIGLSWKSLARYLKVVEEPTIEQIEENRNYTCDEERARMIFYEYQRNVEPSDLKIRLLKALKLANRMDIYDQVQKMLLKET